MKQIACVREDVAVSAPAFWAVLRDFANPQLLAPSITRCDIESEGLGAVRIVHSNRGRIIHERLVQCDEDRLCLQYEVTDDGEMPLDEITRYRATVIVTPIKSDLIAVEWSAEGEVDGPIAPVTAWCETHYRAAIHNITASIAGTN